MRVKSFRASAVARTGVAISALLLSGAAFAQTAEDLPADAQPPTSEPEGVDIVDDTGQLAPSNEIVVSARRRDESVQDVPQTVNVVTAAQVEKLNLRNFTEIASVVPGLQLQSSGAFSNSATVRGVNFSPEASGNNPSVEFYLNDAPISAAFLFQSTFDFGQFELQRGPQGTLRGRAAPSGQIAVTTRRPDLDEVGVVMNGTITDLHARKVDGAFNIPIISDVLAVRVAGVIDNNRGTRVRSTSEITNPQFSEGPFNRTKAIRGSVRFEPTDWAQFNFMYQNNNNLRHGYDQLISESLINPNPLAASAGAVGLPIITARDRLGNGEQGGYNRQDQDVYIGNADFRFAGQRLSYVGSYTKQDNGIFGPQDAANFFAAPRVAVVARQGGTVAGFDNVCRDEAVRQGVNLTTGSYNQCTHSTARRESHELRLASEERIAGIFDYVIGGFYDHNTNPSNLVTETPLATAPAGQANAVLAGTVNPTAVNVNSSGILRRGMSTEKAAFGNLVAHLMDDRLELSGGLRYIDYKNVDTPLLSTPPNAAQVARGLGVPCPDFPALVCTANSGDPRISREKTNKTIYTASVKFKPTSDIMVYALTGTSFRPGPRVVGGFSAGVTALEQTFRILPPETSRGYEIGAKTSFLDGRGRFNIAAYTQKFKNYPFRGPSVFFIATNVSSGNQEVSNFNFVSPVPVTVKGVEGELSFNITDRWSLGVNASYADGKIKNGTIACTDINRDGIPDAAGSTPPLGDATNPQPGSLRFAVGQGQTISACPGVTQRANTTPKFSGNIQSEYGFDLGGDFDLFARGLYSFFGKTTNDPTNPLDDIGFYGLLNLYAGIRDKDGAWELTVFGKNITREREVLSVSNALTGTTVRVGAASSTFTAPYRTITYTAPREFGVTAKIALGSR